ncbi:fungal-specific transcription factor domain-containing protein [Bisporella sp. PMI_857]|nr:fungal-specific transcription factor domain-containing protein [Bisporella sp. PMI_857]
MPQEQSPIDRLGAVEEVEENESGTAEPPAKKRRIFLQTMGQQLREVGVGSGDASFASSIRWDGSLTPPLGHGSATQRSTSRQVQIQTPESDAVPGEDDQLPTGATMSASMALWKQGEVLSIFASDGSDTFTFDDLIAWTRSYFEHWHPAYPFLHAPSILEFFDHVVKHGVLDVAGSSPHMLTVLRSIMSISLADCRQTKIAMRPVPPQLVFLSINAAIQSIQCLLTEDASMLSLQAIVSVQLLLISMLRYNAASRLEGLAVRMAFHLGLHRCPLQFSAFPKKEAGLRQRLFWSMYCIDRYICIRLGVPLAIRDNEIDICFPTLERHGDGAYGPSDNDSRLDLLGFLAKHAKIRGSITELRNKSVSFRQTEVDEAVVIGAELTKWWNEVEEYLESDSSGPQLISRYHQVMLAVLRHESTIALNKHTLATSKSNSAYDAALQTCIGASRSIITTMYRALETGVEIQSSEAQNRSDNYGLLWPSFTWAVWVSVFLVIYAANEGQIPQDVAIRLADRALEVLKHLTLRGTIWPNACAVAIRDLRAQLINRRNRSRHTNDNSRSTPKDGEHSQTISRGPPGLTPQQNNHSSILRHTHNTVSRYEQQQISNVVPLGANQSSFYSHQDIESTHAPGRSQLAPMPPSLQQHAPASVSTIPQPQFPSRSNQMFTELTPNFSTEGAGQAFRMGPQTGLGPELQIPIHEGSELLHELDTPFWMNNDQWVGMGWAG